MAVVMQHFSATAQEHCAVTIPSLVPHGYIAVDLFFILSGFIMSYTYLQDFLDRGWRALGSFFGKRAGRILPLNTFVVLAIVAAGSASVALIGHNIIYTSGDLAHDLPINLLLLQGLGFGTNLNGPSWSISTECAAYVAFPMLIRMVFARRAVVWAPVLLLCAVGLFGIAWTQPRWGLGVEAMPLGLVRCLAGFTLGMGCYRVTQHRAAARLLSRDAVGFALIFGCALFMVLRVDLPAVLLFPALIAALACNRGRVAGLMSWGPLRFLGVISFSLYLIHQVFRPIDLALLQAWHPAPLGGPAALLFALAGSVAVVPFAWATYALVEKPGRTAIRRAVGARPAVKAVA